MAVRAQEGQVLDPRLCHLGEQLVEEHPWGDQGKGPFSARPLRRGFLIGQPLVGTKLGGGEGCQGDRDLNIDTSCMQDLGATDVPE